MFDSTAGQLAPELRPLSAGQLFDRAIRLYRHHFLVFIGIIAISRIPVTLANILLAVIAPAPALPEDSATLLGDSPLLTFLEMSQATGTSSTFGSLVVSIFAWALTLVGAAALTRAAVDAYFGRPVGLLDSYRRLNGDWWTLLGAVFLAGIVGALLGFWTLIPLIGWFTGPGLIFFYALVVVPFITPVIVVERKNASKGLPRALELGQRRFWWFIGFMLLLGIFAQVIVTGPALLLGGGAAALLGEGISPAVSAIVFQTIQLLLNMLYLPIQLTCVLLVYLDIRVRSEGLDLTLKANVNEENPEMMKDPLRLVAEAPQPAIGMFPRRTDLAQYFLFTLVIIGIYIAFVAVGTALVLLFG
jgi:hypothetical protein